MTIVQAALDGANDYALARAAGWRSEADPIDVVKINDVLARRPLCYFVDRETIQKALLDMGTLKIGLCLRCVRSNIGGPYTVDMIGQTQELEHVCVNCALDLGEETHRKHPNGGVWRTDS